MRAIIQVCIARRACSGGPFAGCALSSHETGRRQVAAPPAGHVRDLVAGQSRRLPHKLAVQDELDHDALLDTAEPRVLSDNTPRRQDQMRGTAVTAEHKDERSEPREPLQERKCCASEEPPIFVWI